jgi:hypothetical protein
MVKNALYIFVVLFFIIPRPMVSAQTPTPTPTPIFQVPLATYQYANHFTATSAWHDPVFSLGTADGQIATISAIGYNPLHLDYQYTPVIPPAWGNLIGVKFDLVTKNTGNIYIMLENNGTAISGCAGKPIPNTTVLTHNYIYWAKASECTGLTAAMIADGTLNTRFTYYYGSQTMSASVDSVSYIGIYDSAPYNSDVKNPDDTGANPGSPGDLYEPCASLDITCQIRNLWKYFFITFFQLNTEFGQGLYNQIHDAMLLKKPLAYLAAFNDLDFGQAFEASYSAVPDFNLTYANKYKGVQVFQTQLNVSASTFDPIAPFIRNVRAAVGWVLWLVTLGGILRSIYYIVRGN